VSQIESKTRKTRRWRRGGERVKGGMGGGEDGLRRGEERKCTVNEEEDGGWEVLRIEAGCVCTCGPTHSP
jgi:hypothetical protein